MSSGFDIRALGLDELVKDFESMEPKLQKKILRKAFIKGMAPIRTAIRARVPGKGERSRLLKKSIKPRFAKRSRRGRKGGFLARFISLPTRGKLGILGDDRHYWPGALHAGHKIVRGGKVVGHVRPFPFMSDGFDSAKVRALAIISEHVGSGIQKELKKA